MGADDIKIRVFIEDGAAVRRRSFCDSKPSNFQSSENARAHGLPEDRPLQPAFSPQPFETSRWRTAE
jgi:hypothetical protein